MGDYGHSLPQAADRSKWGEDMTTNDIERDCGWTCNQYTFTFTSYSTFDYRSPSLHLQICSISVVLFTYFTPICCLRQRMPVITHPSSPNHAERCVLSQSSIVRSIGYQHPSYQPSTSCHRLTSSARSSNTCISTTVRTGWQREDLWMGALRSTCSRSPPPTKLHRLSTHIT